jgi:hypothetical protein
LNLYWRIPSSLRLFSIISLLSSSMRRSSWRQKPVMQQLQGGVDDKNCPKHLTFYPWFQVRLLLLFSLCFQAFSYTSSWIISPVLCYWLGNQELVPFIRVHLHSPQNVFIFHVFSLAEQFCNSLYCNIRE